MEIGTKQKMWFFALIILFVVGITAIVVAKLTTKNYEKLISEKEQQIETLQKQSDEYEAKMQDYKAKAKYLAEGIIKSSQKIDTLKKNIEKQREVIINPPETTEETIRRLKEAGFDPKVECK
jgi:uncharacterized membrane-anchored protein YhcB (DUF1043 family)